MLLRCVLPFAVLASVAQAEVVEFELKAGKGRSITLDSRADDRNFREPPGYGAHGANSRRFIRRIEISNEGESALKGRLLEVNERNLTSVEGLRDNLGLSAEPTRQAKTMERLFAFWRDHRSHASCGLPLAYEPFATLNFWGFTLCGEDTQAFARLARAFEIPARFVHLNGHVAAEYRYDGDWHLVDGDQSAVYLRLDNRTFASADDLRADPFLGLRTKVFGTASPQELAASAFNTSLIEHVAPGEPKPLKIKTDPAPLNVFTLHPGETLIWHCDTPPAMTVGTIIASEPDEVRREALASIEHRAIARNYKRAEDGTVSISSPFPIWKAVNETTGMAAAFKAGEVPFRVKVPVKDENDRIAIHAQCSRAALPLFHRGDNYAKLDAREGTARVSIHFDPAKEIVLPEVKLSAPAGLLAGNPAFSVQATKRADRIWWEVSTERDFSFVAPSLEGIVPASPNLRFDALTSTFLNPATTYYIRAKAAQGGLWGEWSESVEFRVAKPPAPAEAVFESAGGGHVRLTWKAPRGKGIVFQIYGSNRRDFVPEAFTDTEIVAMDHLKVTEERENRNLLHSTKEAEYEFVPKHRFYRLICRAGESASVPGPLVVLPDELGQDLPAATILQARASKKGDLDIYLVREEKLPRNSKAESVTR